MRFFNKSFSVLLLLTLVLTGMMGTTSLAATKKIDTVKLSFSYDKAPEAGEAPGSVTAKTSSKEFTVESAEYINDVEVWTLGDKPRVRVVLSAADGYRFSYTTSSHFKLSGRNAEFIKAKIYDNGDTLHLESYLKPVDGKPGGIGGLEWSGTRASWDKSDEAVKHYEVRLYRGSKLVTTVTTTASSYDFRTYISQKGEYTFRVRAISKYQDRAGDWSEHSEENTFTQRDADRYAAGSWVQDQRGWWYRYRSGDYPSNSWQKINHAWYYFNRDGYALTGWQALDGKWYYFGANCAMTTGWQAINGRWYYMNGEGVMLTGWQYLNGHWYYLDGSGAMLNGFQYINGRWYFLNGDGVMLTGWQFLNGHWYYLDGSGAMLTGWQYINGAWYYLDGSGIMYANQATPDGYFVDGNGRWVQ